MSFQHFHCTVFAIKLYILHTNVENFTVSLPREIQIAVYSDCHKYIAEMRGGRFCVVNAVKQL